ncbi:MAG: hypothetical protein V5A82_12590 [Haloferacaceae archaeon]
MELVPDHEVFVVPATPHVPSDDDAPRRAPDIDDIVDRILDRDGPTPVVA